MDNSGNRQSAREFIGRQERVAEGLAQSNYASLTPEGKKLADRLAQMTDEEYVAWLDSNPAVALGTVTGRWSESARGNPASEPQPAPKESPHSEVILTLVKKDLDSRANEGYKKYGTFLKSHNDRDAMWDAYQEALDLAMYLRQAIAERATGK
jgi:hypothetical protein